MGFSVQERARLLGGYIAETGATVRQTAQVFAVSKSTVHADVTQRLRRADRDLYDRVRAVLDENKRERHIRGGNATKAKFARAPDTPPGAPNGSAER
ncbi:MAG: sporulation transcriptional regulator SpoIIID [Clostridia bacterium]|nr:sporulation transcriptional regulator SpoIIID [Clostridia bacterium]